VSGIGAIQAPSPAETWEAWQALLQATQGAGDGLGVAAPEGVEPQPQLQDAPRPTGALEAANRLQDAYPPHHVHQAGQAQDVPPAAVAEARATPDMPPVASLPTPPASADRAQAGTPWPQSPMAALLGDTPAAATRLADMNAAVLPMAPVLMTPLSLQQGPELRWRVQDAPAWRALFDDAGDDAGDGAQDDGQAPTPLEDAEPALAPPPWVQALLAKLRDAAAAPASAACLRPALQAWRVGLPVLLASPAGLASLQASRDASVWQARRWPARWRSARPAAAERWWAVRLGQGPEGHPRTLRDLAGSGGSTGSMALGPGQVSCELRLDDAAPGLARWTEVLVLAAAQPSLRALLAARPSLPWLLCNQALWPQEAP
jgi:hypothetical protein